MVLRKHGPHGEHLSWQKYCDCGVPGAFSPPNRQCLLEEIAATNPLLSVKNSFFLTPAVQNKALIQPGCRFGTHISPVAWIE
jgi:hypothetical protein